MNTSEKRNIYESMAAVMEDCGIVAKDSRNQKQGYKYRGIDAVMNALNPAFRKNKVFVVPEVIDQTREERTTQNGGLLIYSITKVKYTFYAEDGSSIAATVIGEGMDSGDKSMNKAMSAAFKYACFQAFCIPTEEMRDSEEDSPEPESKPAQKPVRQKKAPSPEPKPETPKQRAAAAYPGKDEMIDTILRVSNAEALQKWLANVKAPTVAEAPDTAIMALYNYYFQRGMA